MKYLQSPNSTNAYGLYEEKIGPGHLVAIIEFEPSADGDKLIRPIAAAHTLLAVLTEPLVGRTSDSFADDLEAIAGQLEGRPVYANNIRAKAQAIRAAVAEADPLGRLRGEQ